MPDVPWYIGDDVLCKGKRAVVRYVGETHFAAGVWVGLEFLQTGYGKHDGIVEGTRYFGPTAANHGLFVPANSDSIMPFSQEHEAATRLQSQVRRKQQTEKFNHTQVARAHRQLEDADECEALRQGARSKKAAQLIEDDYGEYLHAKDTLHRELSGQRDIYGETDEEEAAAQAAGVPKIDIHHSRSSAPMVSRDTVDEVLRHIKQPGCKAFRGSDVLRLINAASELFKSETPTALKELQTPSAPGRLVVVGDTHGQVEDILWIFFEHGKPAENNIYLINGDVCDRGKSATEILVLIMVYKLWDPRCIYFNRGNHEDKKMNEAYGFLDECLASWGRLAGRAIFDAFNNFFNWLPLFALVDGNVFVVHGGLWRRQFGLQQLRRVDFNRPVPDSPGAGLDIVVFDSLWSDPQNGRGIGNNSRGDSIITFGPDVTKRFLKSNGFRLLVRSHQVPEDGHGFEWRHHDRCLTVFSASNYCGNCGNLGAVLILTRNEMEQVIEHWAPPKGELLDYESEADHAMSRIRGQVNTMAAYRKNVKASRQKMEADIGKRVHELLVRHKQELFEYWSALDNSPRGLFQIPLGVWREGCQTILDDTLPWVRLQEILEVADQHGVVHYVKFLTRYRVAFDASYGLASSGWERAVWGKLMEILLKADLPLREALAAFDSTHDGLVSGVEFTRLLDSCNVRIPPLQARALLRTVVTHSKMVGQAEPAVPANWSQGEADHHGARSPSELREMHTGRASVWEVLGRLQVSLPVHSGAAANPSQAAWAVPLLRPMATAVLDDAFRRLTPEGSSHAEWPVSKLLAAWFEDVDTSQNGYLEHEEFVNALMSLAPALQRAGCPTDRDSLSRIVRFCDMTGDGNINYFELLNNLTWEDSLDDEFREDLMETINSFLFFNLQPMRSALQRFDPARTGLVCQADFTAALRAVHVAHSVASNDGEEGRQLTRGQIDAIAGNLPVGEDNQIDYERFLQSFRVVDTHSLIA